MRRRVTIVILCVCMCVCLSVAELTATYLVCESKMRCYKVPYGIPTTCFVWISPKMLCSPVLASFADSKLLDFSRASDRMTWHINRIFYVARYTRYVQTINPRRMHYRHSSQPPPLSLSQSTIHWYMVSFRQSWDGSGFFSTLRICMFSCHAMCILVVPFDSLAS